MIDFLSLGELYRLLLRPAILLSAALLVVWLWNWATPMRRHKRWIFWVALIATIIVLYGISYLPKSNQAETPLPILNPGGYT
jgi:FtsH-binding integral membrane protein